MVVRLELQHEQPDRLSLSIPLRVRLLPGLISGWLLYAIAGAGGNPVGAPSAAALVLFLLSAFAALYDDRWIFDMDRKKVVHRIGLLFAAREMTFEMGELKRFVLAGRIASGDRGTSGTGRAGGLAEPWRAAMASYAILSLEDSAGTCRRLEQYRGIHAGDLRRVAAEVAAFCGLPLEDLTTPA